MGYVISRSWSKVDDHSIGIRGSLVFAWYGPKRIPGLGFNGNNYMGVADHLQAMPGFFSQDDPTRTLESVGAVSVNALFNVNDKALARQIFGYLPIHIL